jgi:Ca-activated chloride channel family protein
MEVTVDPGIPIAALRSPSHAIRIEKKSDSLAIVRNDASDREPNKDFILSIDLRGSGPSLTVLTHRQGEEDGYVCLALQPPALPEASEILAKDMFFVLDTSGSMSGMPLEASKALVIEALKNLNPSDRFTIMRFSDNVSTLSQKPLPNTPQNVRAAIEYVGNLQGEGGTEMLSGIEKAIAGKPEPGRVRIVFFLTDGYIGNDDEILAAIAGRNQAQARIFSMGVGSSVNRSLLSNMARVGRGRLAVMRFDEPVLPYVRRFYDQVRSPILTDVSLEWQGLEISDQTPAIVADLFDGQPLLVHARYEEPGKGNLVVRGKLGNKPWHKVVPLDLPHEAHRPAIANLWARDMIRGWSDEEASQPGSREDEIATLALGHNLLSHYTSFVAVDRRVARPATEPLIPVAQRLPLPEGVSRNALGELSRQEIPPGDPFITIHAPVDARRVTAFFPFGLVKDLKLDEQRGAWRGRFLVPAGIPDGYYTIVVAIETHSGLITYHEEVFHLDSEGQEMIIDFDDIELQPGKARLFRVDTIEAAAEVYIHCETLGWRRVAMVAEPASQSVRWNKWLKVKRDAPAGQHEVLVVMRDLAGNRIEQRVTVTVAGEHR